MSRQLRRVKLDHYSSFLAFGITGAALLWLLCGQTVKDAGLLHYALAAAIFALILYPVLRGLLRLLLYPLCR
ncbi:MAG: hypothetical protein RQ722_12915 [Desulfuromonadales bacterium]|nr:hypothetical protein [Desulfuromonadales bacterium]